MEFIQIQIIILLTIVISSVIGGKKASLLASAVWVIETIIVYRISHNNYLQVITVALSFQIGIVLAIIRDFISSRIKKSRSKIN